MNRTDEQGEDGLTTVEVQCQWAYNGAGRCQLAWSETKRWQRSTRLKEVFGGSHVVPLHPVSQARPNMSHQLRIASYVTTTLARLIGQPDNADIITCLRDSPPPISEPAL